MGEQVSKLLFCVCRTCHSVGDSFEWAALWCTGAEYCYHRDCDRTSGVVVRCRNFGRERFGTHLCDYHDNLRRDAHKEYHNLPACSKASEQYLQELQLRHDYCTEYGFANYTRRNGSGLDFGHRLRYTNLYEGLVYSLEAEKGLDTYQDPALRIPFPRGSPTRPTAESARLLHRRVDLDWDTAHRSSYFGGSSVEECGISWFPSLDTVQEGVRDAHQRAYDFFCNLALPMASVPEDRISRVNGSVVLDVY